MVCYTTDKQMGYPCEINVVDSRNFNPDETVFKVAIPTGGPKVIISSIVLLAPINIWWKAFLNFKCLLLSL